MNNVRELKLNFLPLKQQEFTFAVFRKRSKPGETQPDETLHEYSLPMDVDHEEWQHYWVGFEAREAYEKYQCKENTNAFLTRLYMYNLLERNTANLDNRLDLEGTTFAKRIFFILSDHNEGWQTVWLEPYYLREKKLFGFLTDFRFKRRDEENLDIMRCQQLSLSLDERGNRNRNYYLDKYRKIAQFVKETFPKISLLRTEPTEIRIEPNLESIGSNALKMKQYIFGNDLQKNSQFKGIQEYGPLKEVDKPLKFVFVFLKKHRTLALDLFSLLSGEAEPYIFPGMEKMFNIPFSKENVSAVYLDEFTEEKITGAFKTAESTPDGVQVFPVIITPSKKESDIYYKAKFVSVTKREPCQVVTVDTLKNRNTLKWAAASIGLQLFAKAGGIPWKVMPSNEKCLIIGIGQSHDEEDGTIRKYFSYSVLTDSSGIFKDIQVLSQSEDESVYLKNLGKKLGDLVEEHTPDYDKFAIHTPFKLKRNEMEVIRDKLEELNERLPSQKEFCVIKINTDNKFFAFCPGSNSLVPYESTYARLSYDEFLIWFEGLQYGSESVTRLISGPTHVQFYYSSKKLNDKEKTNYLQDVINLSGANWRGFNAKSLPVSMYYCQIVARFVREFSRLGYDAKDISNLTPWFL